MGRRQVQRARGNQLATERRALTAMRFFFLPALHEHWQKFTAWHPIRELRGGYGLFEVWVPALGYGVWAKA